jgi:ABC-type molybdate transport system substrate-binding protein
MFPCAGRIEESIARGPAAELMVYAAASLTDVMKELASIYERQSGDKLAFNFNASSMQRIPEPGCGQKAVSFLRR